MDTLLSRYGGGTDYVLKLDIEQGVQIALHCLRQKREERLFNMWVALLPWNKEIGSFDEFVKNMELQSKAVNLPDTPDNEIMDMARQIEVKYQEQKGG